MSSISSCRNPGPSQHSQFRRILGSAAAGMVGNFEVTLDTHGVKQIMHAGAVILGEQSRKRIPYMPMADLPAHIVESAMQKRGVTGIPFFSPRRNLHSGSLSGQSFGNCGFRPHQGNSGRHAGRGGHAQKPQAEQRLYGIRWTMPSAGAAAGASPYVPTRP